MTKLLTHAALAAVLAGAFAVTTTTPSRADNDTWIAAGAGFAAGTLIGAAAANANANVYYGPGYAYAPGYPYGYASAYPYGYASAYPYGYAYAPAPAYAYVEAPAYVAVAPAPRAYGYAYAPARTEWSIKNSDPDPRIGGSVRVGDN